MRKLLILSVGLVLGLGSMAEAASITSDTRPTVHQSLIQHADTWVECGDKCFVGDHKDQPGRLGRTCSGNKDAFACDDWTCRISCGSLGPPPDKGK